jgi:TonB-linked SusC/RagA family outer membrane protein
MKNSINFNRSSVTGTLFSKVRLMLLVVLMLVAGGAMSSASAQGNAYSGKVLDAEGSSLIGVNVMVEGTTVGTVTDVDGNFSLSYSADEATLIVSFIGYKTKEVEASVGDNLTITLEEDLMGIDQVVVVGYGVQKKSLVTGAISSVKSEDMENSSNARVGQALQGRTAGVTVLPTSGSPGAGSKIRIRGVSSNGNSDPLYIVDGMKTGSIDNIAPNDIESIEILKDAASAAIYGTEGANGVILITTKGGTKGESKISYNFQAGIQSSRTKMKLMSAEQYVGYLDEADIQSIDSYDYDTDWLGEVFENAPMQKHHISFSGGNDKSTYMISGSYLNQDGIVGGNNANFERFTARINGKHQIKEWLEVGNNLSYSHFTRKSIGEDDEYRGVLNNALLIDPLTPVVYPEGQVPQNVTDMVNSGQQLLRNEDGDIYGLPAYTTGEIANPIAAVQTYKGGLTSDKVLGSFYATLKPLKGLSITSRFGFDLAYNINHSWSPVYYVSSERQNGTNTIDDNIDKYFSWLWENFASYNMNFGENNLTLLAGYSAESYQHPSFYLHSAPMPKEGENYAYHNYSSRDYDQVGGDLEETRRTSVFGRLSYDYANKYMIESSFRYDASSVFPENNKGAFFPSLSAGWLISEEDFWGDLGYLKLRASWGQNGSDANLPGNEDKEFWIGEGIRLPNANGNYYPGYKIEKMTNPDLRWERSEQLDVGVDYRAFNGKLSLAVDYYDKQTKDLIIMATPPLSVGLNPSFINGGDVSNKGFDFEVGYRDNDGEFKYGVSANLSTVNNEVTKINSPTPIMGVNVRGSDVTVFEEGEPIWYFYGYKTDGIDAQTGAPNVVDTDGKEGITAADKTNIGDPHPDFVYGGNINLSYMGFDFSMFLQGTYGNDIYMAWYRNDRPKTNKPEYFYTDRWTGAGDESATMPKPDASSDYIYRSDLMIADGSYMRIKQLQLGYTLPSDVVNRIGIGRARLYVSLDDYFTITKYKGLDPEAGSNNDASQGIDRGVYPIPGKFMFGLSIDF